MFFASKRLRTFATGLILLAAAAVVMAWQAESTPENDVTWKPLPGTGKKCQIDEGFYFTYDFSEKPKLGTIVLIVKVYDKSKAQVAPFTIMGRSDMPAMQGAHDSGEVEFKLNKVQDYLLPISVAMPGEWEVKLTILKDGKAIFHGSIKFDV